MKTHAMVHKPSETARRRVPVTRLSLPGPAGRAQRAEIRYILGSPRTQAKLATSQPGDKHEQEADRVAKTVMQMSAPDGSLSQIPRPLENAQGGSFEVDAPRVAGFASGGQSSSGVQCKLETPAQLQGDVGEAANRTGMPGRLKAGLEALSGMDLSGIRVHTNSSKPAQINALAYTQGQDIHVGPGQEKHLPHEGWHAVQQMQGRVKPTRQANGLSINDDEKLEREADVMGTKAVQTTTPGVQPLSAGPGTQRKGESGSQRNEFITQKKVIDKTLDDNPGIKIDSLESIRGVSQLKDSQPQSTEENEQKRAEYETQRPQSGTGEQTETATPASQGGMPREDESPSQLKSDHVAQLAGCTPKNFAVGTGALASASITRASWRSHVTYRARVRNQSGNLRVSMYVFAKVYYGLWVSWEHLRFNATVDLTCQKTGSSCEIAANERGGSVWDVTDSPASGAIAVQTDRRAGTTQMALTVRVGGSVGANSSVSAGVGPASVGVSFPDASISHKMSMGTFIYTCST